MIYSLIAIAYVDQNGNGFTDKEPWVDEGNGSYQERVLELISMGYKNVIPFSVEDNLESYTWEYINKHKIVSN